MNFSNHTWPCHKPETTLDQIIIDGISRDFDDDQIIEETCGIANHTMIKTYRDQFELDMVKFYKG